VQHEIDLGAIRKHLATGSDENVTHKLETSDEMVGAMMLDQVHEGEALTPDLKGHISILKQGYHCLQPSSMTSWSPEHTWRMEVGTLPVSILTTAVRGPE
jgi:hypothetical protein